MTSVNADGSTIFRSIELAGIPKHDRGSQTTTPGSFVTVKSVTIGAGKKRDLAKVYLSCSISGRMNVKINGSIVDSARTAPGRPNIDYNWAPYREVVANDVIDIEFRARTGSVSADVETVLMSVENDL